MPGFAFDYLEGGCIDEIGLEKNRSDLQKVQLRSRLLAKREPVDTSTTIFGQTYKLPFGVAPVGLQGLMWPNAPEILAKTAKDHGIPFILSTVSSTSLERIAEITEGQAWFQLYNPTKSEVRDDMFDRLSSSGYSVLVVTVDVQTFGYRARDIVNGLSMPPKMTVKNIFQMLRSPSWLMQTIVNGKPEMKNLKPYFPKNVRGNQLAALMNETVMGRVDVEALKAIRDRWDGKMVIKGLINPADIEDAARIGVDGVILSNHGGRQLDYGESPIEALAMAESLSNKDLTIMMDSGVRSGSDIAAVLSCGADFTFLGRTFMYGTAALGNRGGDHTVNMLKQQLIQVMSQLCCRDVNSLREFRVQ